MADPMNLDEAKAWDEGFHAGIRYESLHGDWYLAWHSPRGRASAGAPEHEPKPPPNPYRADALAPQSERNGGNDD